MRGSYMLIAYHLSSDKSWQTILHSCAHPNRLPSTASIIKMCPHLHVHKKKHSSLYSAQNLQFCEISQSHTEPTFHKLDVAGLVQCGESLTDCRMKGHGFDSWDRTNSQGLKRDVTWDDSQRRFLAQHSVAMLEQCSNCSKQCSTNVATLCRAKNRRCESSRVTSP